ncbi:unnamed protein product [Onchocerca flexuosa]|uniref:Uncharacterized protein n=1 Tax=Onchocerca flexuosa TaxID=387005 RepID=A0A183HD66_9BILA|nr:unnamed protein product [Onchocerca flexuosa]
MLSRCFQNCAFTINNNIRRAVRIIKRIIKEKCCDSFSSAYAFTADPNEVNHKFYTIKVVLTITCAMDTLMKRNTGLKEKVYIEVKEMKCFKN